MLCFAIILLTFYPQLVLDLLSLQSCISAKAVASYLEGLVLILADWSSTLFSKRGEMIPSHCLIYTMFLLGYQLAFSSFAYIKESVGFQSLGLTMSKLSTVNNLKCALYRLWSCNMKCVCVWKKILKTEGGKVKAACGLFGAYLKSASTAISSTGPPQAASPNGVCWRLFFVLLFVVSPKRKQIWRKSA